MGHYFLDTQYDQSWGFGLRLTGIDPSENLDPDLPLGLCSTCLQLGNKIFHENMGTLLNKVPIYFNLKISIEIYTCSLICNNVKNVLKYIICINLYFY